MTRTNDNTGDGEGEVGSATDRIECLVRRQLAHMEGPEHGHVRCDDAEALRNLTASWANLLKAGPS